MQAAETGDHSHHASPSAMVPTRSLRDKYQDLESKLDEIILRNAR